ncbi:MAG: hypothetical protein EP335_14200 [Alphaproteobacteria bacterium]|nr:MAG: hypothetical protein EP335_14200 [Alphaproteobacteria bacterium]
MNDFVSELRGAEQLSDPGLRHVFRLWCHKTERLRHFPSWHDFTVSELSETIPHMALVDLTDRRSRFRVKFSGSQYDEIFGCDLTGHYLEELPDAAGVQSRARRAAAGMPLHIRGLPMSWKTHGSQTYQAICLPLKSDPDSDVDQLLYMMIANAD